MSSTNSIETTLVECDCSLCRMGLDCKYISNEPNPWYPCFGQQAVYFAQTSCRNNYGKKPNCFIRAFKWYTEIQICYSICAIEFLRIMFQKEHEPPSTSGEGTCRDVCHDRNAPNFTEFANWLDLKYEEFLAQNICCRETKTILEGTNVSQQQMQPKCSSKRKFPKFKGAWKKHRATRSLDRDRPKQYDSESERMQQSSVHYLLPPKNVSRAASERCLTPCCSINRETVKSQSATRVCVDDVKPVIMDKPPMPPVEQRPRNASFREKKRVFRSVSCECIVPLMDHNVQTTYSMEICHAPEKYRLQDSQAYKPQDLTPKPSKTNVSCQRFSDLKLEAQCQCKQPIQRPPCPTYNKLCPSYNKKPGEEKSPCPSLQVVCPADRTCPTLREPCPPKHEPEVQQQVPIHQDNQIEQQESFPPCPTYNEPCPSSVKPPSQVSYPCPSLHETCSGRRPCPSLRQPCQKTVGPPSGVRIHESQVKTPVIQQPSNTQQPDRQHSCMACAQNNVCSKSQERFPTGQPFAGSNQPGSIQIECTSQVQRQDVVIQQIQEPPCLAHPNATIGFNTPNEPCRKCTHQCPRRNKPQTQAPNPDTSALTCEMQQLNTSSQIILKQSETRQTCESCKKSPSTQKTCLSTEPNLKFSISPCHNHGVCNGNMEQPDIQQRQVATSSTCSYSMRSCKSPAELHPMYSVDEEHATCQNSSSSKTCPSQRERSSIVRIKTSQTSIKYDQPANACEIFKMKSSITKCDFSQQTSPCITEPALCLQCRCPKCHEKCVIYTEQNENPQRKVTPQNVTKPAQTCVEVRPVMIGRCNVPSPFLANIHNARSCKPQTRCMSSSTHCLCASDGVQTSDHALCFGRDIPFFMKIVCADKCK